MHVYTHMHVQVFGTEQTAKLSNVCWVIAEVTAGFWGGGPFSVTLAAGDSAWEKAPHPACSGVLSSGGHSLLLGMCYKLKWA